MRAAVVGFGAIGSQVATGIQQGDVPGVELAGVVVRRPGSVGGAAPELSLAEAIEGADLIVECAGGEAATSLAPQVLEAGRDLLLVSIGALADAGLRQQLADTDAGGRLFLSTGAIGGLDLLTAAGAAGGLDHASLTTTKQPRALVQAWMNEAERDAVLTSAEATTVFEGSVQEAIEKFPASLNVAVALAAATGLWDDTVVRLVADAQAPRTSHRIQAAGSLGSYDFRIENDPLVDNPASSAIVAKAMLQGIRRISGAGWKFV